MKMDETEYTELYMELEKYEKRGIDMLLDGYQASPLQIVTAHMVKEAGTYMRDYTTVSYTHLDVYKRQGHAQFFFLRT